MLLHGKSYQIRDIMREPAIVQDDSKRRDVMATLVDTQSNIAVVVDSEGVFVGAVSTLDVIRAILPDYIEFDEVAAKFVNDQMLIEDAQKAADLPVKEFISKHDTSVPADASLVEATVMASKGCNGRIIVLDEQKKPIGLLTRTEIKQVLAAFLDIRDELPQV